MEWFIQSHTFLLLGGLSTSIAIPLLSAGTTYLSSKVMMSKSSSSAMMDENNPAMQSMKMMNYMMPIMMGVMTISLPAGLGVYWTVSNLLQAGQTLLVVKFLKNKESKLEEEKK